MQCPLRVNSGSQPRPRKRLLSGAKRKSISGHWTSETSHDWTFRAYRCTRPNSLLNCRSSRNRLGGYFVPEDRAERRLTTILAADVVGYSRLMAADEAGTLTSLKAIRRELFEPKAAQYPVEDIRRGPPRARTLKYRNSSHSDRRRPMPPTQCIFRTCVQTDPSIHLPETSCCLT